MRRLICVVALAVSAAMGVAACAEQPGPSPRELAVQLNVYGCNGAQAEVGTGTAIGGSRVLTAAHVIAGATRIEVTPIGRPGEVVTETLGNGDVELLGVDIAHDLAVLSVDGLDRRPLHIGTVPSGTSGRLVGAGTGPDPIEFAIERAVDLTFTGDDAGLQARPGFEVHTATVAGDSGAGLLVDATLGGVIFASSTETDGRAWATAAEPILALLAATDSQTASTDPGDCGQTSPSPQ